MPATCWLAAAIRQVGWLIFSRGRPAELMPTFSPIRSGCLLFFLIRATPVPLMGDTNVRHSAPGQARRRQPHYYL